MDNDMKKRCDRWQRELVMLSEVNIPRHFTNCESQDDCSLITFYGTSKVAYAAAVILRSANGEEISVQFVHAKSQAAALKNTIVR
jgi:hypothetical protein